MLQRKDTIDAATALLTSQLETLEGKKSGLIAQIATIDQSMARLRSERIRFRNRLAPIMSLPHEVFALIFAAGKQPLSIGPPRAKWEILLSHICCDIRELACNSSFLWTSIHTSCSAKSVAAAHMYISRSKGALLDILVKPQVPITVDAIRGCFNVLHPHVYRWRSLQVQTQRSDHSHAVGAFLFKSSAPALKVLKLSLCKGEDEDEIYDGQLFADDTPNLVDLRINNITNLRWFSSLRNISTLQLYNPLLGSFGLAAILNEMRAMKTLVLSGDLAGVYSDWSMFGPIELPVLSYLSFRACEHFQNFWGLLKLLQSPNLQTICLVDMAEPDFEDFIRESDHPAMRHSIKKLRISSCTVEDGADFHAGIWNALICAFPDVTHLDLCNGLVEPFLDALQINSSNPECSRWTRLDTFEIYNEHHLIVPWGVIKDIIARQHSSERPLQRLLLPSQYFLDPALSKELFWVKAMVKVDTSLRRRSPISLSLWPGGPVEEYY